LIFAGAKINRPVTVDLRGPASGVDHLGHDTMAV
jgi:hypothetical protein